MYPSPAHSSNPSPPRANHGIPSHSKDLKPQSSVIVENKAGVKMENPVTAHSHHHNSASLSSASSSSSSPHAQPRPAHMPEQRSEHNLSSNNSMNTNISHHLITQSSMPSTTHISQPSHPTAFRTLDPKSMARSQSPYKVTGQPGPQQLPQQQGSAHSQSQPQPINYCKPSNTKVKSQSGGAPSGSNGGMGTYPSTIAQPPVSLPASSLAYSYSLIQQGLVPNPMYSQGVVSAAVQMARSQVTTPATTSAITTSVSTAPHNAYSSTGPPTQSQACKPQQPSPGATGSKRKAGGCRDNGTIQKRSKAAASATAESEASKRPHTSIVSVSVTTPPLSANTSPYTTTSSNVLNLRQSAPLTVNTNQPVSVSLSGFMDSFKSFVEHTVQNAFLQDEKTAREKEERERSQRQQQELKQQQPRPGVVEKIDTPPPTTSSANVSELGSVSLLTSPTLASSLPGSNSSSMASIMDTINRVANGQVDTDSDTLSAPSPPPQQTRPDASPLGRGAVPTAPKLKKAWLQRHSDEDKKPAVYSPSPLTIAQEDSNSSQSTSREVKLFLKSGGGLDSSPVISDGGIPSPVTSLNLPNGDMTDLIKHANDESTSSASETESQVR